MIQKFEEFTSINEENKSLYPKIAFYLAKRNLTEKKAYQLKDEIQELAPNNSWEEIDDCLEFYYNPDDALPFTDKRINSILLK